MINKNIVFPFYDNNKVVNNSLCLIKGSYKQLTNEDLLALHHQELAYSQKFDYTIPKQSYLLGRLSAKKALKQYFPSLPSNEVLIYPGVLGQPLIRSIKPINMEVTISHLPNAGVALVFDNKYPMGIDIELINTEHTDAMKQLVSVSELSKLNQMLPYEEEVFTITSIWTMKEAISKVLKCGLTVPFPILEISSFNLYYSYIACEFTNFLQYRGISWQEDQYCVGLVYPKQLYLKYD